MPHPRAIKPTPRWSWKLRHFFALAARARPRRSRANDFAYVDELWRRWSPAWKDDPGERDRGGQRSVRPSRLRRGGVRVLRVAAEPDHAEVAARQHQGPDGVVRRRDDDAIKPRTFEKARTCFDASYEVIQVPGGHFMHREHPEVFIPELVKALRQHEQRVRQS